MSAVRRSERIHANRDLSSVSAPTTDASDAASDATSGVTTSGTSLPNQDDKAGGGKFSWKRQKLQDAAPANTPDTSVNDNVVLETPRRDPRRVRGRQGYLKFMTEVPLDVIYEIFRELHPVDLLHLSWACKSLNVIVMSKSAKYLWENAFARLYESENPPPACPKDLNFAQYTRFLFISKCMECATGPGNWDSWLMRLRACVKCLTSERFIPELSCATVLPHPVGIKYKKATFLRRTEYEELAARKNALGPPYTPELGAFYEERRNFHNERTLGLAAYKKWKENRIQNRKEELGCLRLNREATILAKLGELGWKQSDLQALKDHQLGHLPSFSKAKELTDREWETLRPKLVKRLEELIPPYRERMRRLTLEERYWTFNTQVRIWQAEQGFDWRLRLHTYELVVLEPFKSAFLTSSESDVEFSLAEIDRVARGWGYSLYTSLSSLLPQELQTSIAIQPNGDPPRNFPVSIVLRSESDPSNDRPIFFEEALRERIYKTPEHPDEPEVSALLQAVSPFHMPRDWERPKFLFYPEAHETMKAILKLLGKDPATATVIDCGDPFICLRCEQRSAGTGRKMTWKSTHELTQHKNEEERVPELKWRLGHW